MLSPPSPPPKGASTSCGENCEGQQRHQLGPAELHYLFDCHTLHSWLNTATPAFNHRPPPGSLPGVCGQRWLGTAFETWMALKSCPSPANSHWLFLLPPILFHHASIDTLTPTSQQEEESTRQEVERGRVHPLSAWSPPTPCY